jgi:putative transposase
MRSADLDSKKASFPVNRMREVLGVSQRGLLAWKGRPTCRCLLQDMVYLTHI